MSKNEGAFIMRLRKQDTPTGVSAQTVDLLMTKTGLNRTELVHLALKQMAQRYLEQSDMASEAQLLTATP